MGIFSLSWFKSEHKKQLEELKLEEQRLKNEILEKQISFRDAVPLHSLGSDPLEEVSNTPYKKLKLVNDVLTIVLNDGNIISKANATIDDFKKAREATKEADLFKIATSTEGLEEKRKQEEEIAKSKAIIEGVELLKKIDNFEVMDGSVYLKPVKRSLPKLLVERFAQVLTSDKNAPSGEYEALKKFWLKCCLNPNAQSAEDLYEFLTHHNFKIDKHGNFYAYRRVVSKNDQNKELVEFVSNAYNKVKAVWKKKPKDYYVWQEDDGTFSFTKNGSETDGINKFHGNLEELYLNLPSLQEKMYTSAHTGQEDYRVGSVISMPRNDGNDDNSVSCSKGFHAASKAYDYSGFGDTPILVIINPMDVLAVPLGEVGKLRTCRWFFATTLPEDEKHILDDNDFDVSELGDIFEEQCSKDLQGYVQNSFAEEVKRHTFTLPSITGQEINNTILSLEEMKKSISDRVVNAYEEEEEE